MPAPETGIAGSAPALVANQFGRHDPLIDNADINKWIEIFSSSGLDSVLHDAANNNRELAAARGNLEAAAVFAQHAGASLTRVVDTGENKITPGCDLAGANVCGPKFNLAWEVDLWSRLTADEHNQVNKDYLEAASQSLLTQTTKAWFLAIETNLQLELAGKAEKLQREILRIAQADVESGITSQHQLHLASARLEAAKQRLHFAIAALTHALRGLQRLVGRYPTAELESAYQFVPPAPAIADGMNIEELPWGSFFLTAAQILDEREALLIDSVQQTETELSRAKRNYGSDQLDDLSLLRMRARILDSRISLVRIRYARLTYLLDLHLMLGEHFRRASEPSPTG